MYLFVSSRPHRGDTGSHSGRCKERSHEAQDSRILDPDSSASGGSRPATPTAPCSLLVEDCRTSNKPSTVHRWQRCTCRIATSSYSKRADLFGNVSAPLRLSLQSLAIVPLYRWLDFQERQMNASAELNCPLRCSVPQTQIRPFRRNGQVSGSGAGPRSRIILACALFIRVSACQFGSMLVSRPNHCKNTRMGT